MDIRCLWSERAATADWRRNTGAEPAESGGHTLAAAPCHNQFYGIRSVRAGDCGYVRNRGGTAFGFHRCMYSQGVRRPRDPWRIILLVIVLGLLSNIVGDAGYIILLPIAATLFQSVGLHPIGGIITAYVPRSCLHFIIYHITRRSLLPHLGMYAGDIHFNGYKQLSRKERRAMLGAVFAGLLYIAIILWATFSSWGILRSVNGGLIRSPFIVGILFLLSFGIGLMGMVYGFASGRYRTDGDVIEGLTQPMKLLGVYFVIAFFASQMFACFEYSHLDKCIACH